MDGVGAEEEQAPEGLGCECHKDTSLNTRACVGDAGAASSCGTGSSALSASQSTAAKEEGEDTLVREDGISHSRSGMCTEKASGGVPGDLYKKDVCGPAACQLFRCASANTATQQPYKVSSVLKAGSSHYRTKGKKLLLENPEILPRVRKKTRTLYTAEQLKELEKMFQEDHYPDNEKRREIAAVVGVTPQRIMIWFQNRRAKWRKVEKWKMRNNNSSKCPTSSVMSMHFGTDGYGAPPLPGIAHDGSAMLSADTCPGSYSSQLSGHPAPHASSSDSLAADMVASCEAVQTKALAECSFSSSRMECCPNLPSPPPIRRASLPLSLAFNPHSHIVPLMLDTPSSECSLSRQENGAREAFSYSIQNQGLSSPTSCTYPEQLESVDNLESSYCQYSSQSGNFQLPQYSQQHQLSRVHPLPSHVPSNALSSIQLSPAVSSESHTAFLNFPESSGAVSYGAAAATQDYAQAYTAGELLLQQPCGNSADIPAHQAVPWNDFYMQEAPFSNQPRSQVPFASTAGHHFSEHISYTQAPCLPSSLYFQVPKGMTQECMPHAGKREEVTSAEQNSYQNHQPETLLAGREEAESSSEEGEAVVGN